MRQGQPTGHESRARRIRRATSLERGESLLEVMAAMTILAVAIAALFALLISSNLSQQRAEGKGTAVTLANAQMEVYRGIAYPEIRLDAASIPSGTDPYVTGHSLDPTIPSATGQVIGGSAGEAACTSPLPPECLPIQTTTGPDNRSYRVDTYITYVTTPGAGAAKLVTIVVRQLTGGTPGPILARAVSAFDASSL